MLKVITFPKRTIKHCRNRGAVIVLTESLCWTSFGLRERNKMNHIVRTTIMLEFLLLVKLRQKHNASINQERQKGDSLYA